MPQILSVLQSYGPSESHSSNIVHIQHSPFKTPPITTAFGHLYSKTCLKQPLKRPKNVFLRLVLNAGQSIAECSKGEHSAILLICIK